MHVERDPKASATTREEPEDSPLNEMRPLSAAVYRVILPSLLSLERILDNIEATQEVP